MPGEISSYPEIGFTPSIVKRKLETPQRTPPAPAPLIPASSNSLEDRVQKTEIPSSEPEANYATFLAQQKNSCMKRIEALAPGRKKIDDLYQSQAEIKKIRSGLIKASFLIFTLILTLPALHYYEKESKKNRGEIDEYQKSRIDTFLEMEKEIDSDERIIFKDKEKLIRDIANELGLSHPNLFYQRSGSLAWKDQLEAITNDYKEKNSWNTFSTKEELVAFILHLKEKGAFSKNSEATINFVIDLFRPELDSKPQPGEYDSPKEVWEAGISLLIDDCLKGHYGPERKRAEEAARSIIIQFIKDPAFQKGDLTKGMPTNYYPLLQKLQKAGLFDDHKFFMTCNLLEKHLGISRPAIIEIFNGLPSWKPKSE